MPERRPYEGPLFSCPDAAAERRDVRSRQSRVMVTVACLTAGCVERLRFDQPPDHGVLRTACTGCGSSFALDGGRVRATSRSSGPDGARSRGSDGL